MISIRNIKKRFNNKDVIKNFSLEIKPNTSYGLCGPNGSGKTTLLKIIANLMHCDSGNIYSEDDLKISYVSNNPRSFFLRLSGWENLFYYGSLNGCTKEDVKRMVGSLFKDFNFEKVLEKPINEISVGQIQITSLIRSFLNKPELLLLDEVTSNLDAPNTQKTLKLFRDYRDYSKKFSYINCSHNEDFLKKEYKNIIRLK